MKYLLDQITIKTRFILAFALIMVLFTGFGLFSLREMKRLGTLTATLYNHPLRVSNRSLKASMGVIRMHRGMKDVALAESALDLHEAIRVVRSEEALVYEHLDVVRAQILGQEGKALEKETRDLFSRWKPIREEVIRLVSEGKKAEAARITREKGADYVALLEDKMLELTAYARNKADHFMANAETVQQETSRRTLAYMGLFVLMAGGIACIMLNGILSNISSLRETMSAITSTGRLARSDLTGKNEMAQMASHFNLLIGRLENQFWFRDGLNALNRELSGDLPYTALAEKGLHFISRYAEACAGALYAYDAESSVCELKASFAFVERQYLANRFKQGEGIVGQVAVEKSPILLTRITRDEAIARTGTVSEPPRAIYAFPLIYEDVLYGVMEVASFEAIGPTKKEFLDAAAKVIAISLYTASQREQINALYTETRQSNEALEAKTGELNAANERLTALNDELRAQADELQAQAEELKAQKVELETQRLQVEEADRLKSEFLSNMSHELRTPLNSVLALSQLMLTKGTGRNPEQEKEYLRVIERNGRHLLSLINDILDLSKIEAGRMDLFLTDFSPWHTVQQTLETIRPMADEKGLAITVQAGDETAEMHSDEDKLQQILLNLFSNAVKFTEKGEITIGMRTIGNRIHFSVQDTGIGIRPEDRLHIFDEFRQADGSTTRVHEGTGLGLAICQKLAHLLGGDISVSSTPGEGSLFTLTLPRHAEEEAATPPAPEKGHKEAPDIEEPAAAVSSPPSDHTVLVIDDDPKICEFLETYLNESGYRVVTAQRGKAGLEKARQLRPFAITLDILMPDMDGWEVLRELKSAPDTADIPVIIVSVSDDQATGSALGAVGYVLKPVDRHLLISEIRSLEESQKLRRILVVDDDPLARKQLEDILSGMGYWPECVGGGEAALAAIRANRPDAVLLDLMMPDMDGFAVLEQIRSTPVTLTLPVIILTAKDLNGTERSRLERSVHQVITKQALDTDRLLKQIQDALGRLGPPPPTAQDRRRPLVLVVEDNEVAGQQICSALAEEGYAAHRATGGADALEFVARQVPDAVVLDLMMPEVDGFQVLEAIRSAPRSAGVPVLVLTAKELTAADRARLRHDNIQQLVQKGTVDREQLVRCVADLLSPAKPITPSGQADAKASNSGSPVFLPDEAGPLLIVEDNPDNLMTITAILDELGYQYITADDGHKAVARAKEFRPRLILMDVQLPGLSGPDATRQIKADPSMADIPILAITARAMRGDRERILAAGCDDYLAKPIDPSELATLIRKWLR